MERTLTIRELNRATLARQMLLDREAVAIPQAIERLAGMQAQLAVAPYVGLWTRIREFERDALARHIEDRAVVKATMMRGTLHLVSAADYLWFRSTLQPVLTAGAEAITKNRGATFDLELVLRFAREFLAAGPRSFAEMSAALEAAFPGVDVGGMRYTVRTHLRLVQVPSDTRWSYPGNARFALAEAWLGQPVDPAAHLPDLVRRYLAAFGPATIADMQTWSGFRSLKAAVEALRPELVTYRGEQQRELFDLPGAPIPDAETLAPVRFLPEYDNLLLAHANRRRVIADEHKKRVYLPALRVAATFLVDGFVAGTWKLETSRRNAVMVLSPFASLPALTLVAVAEEADQLARFIEPGAASYDLRVSEPA